MRIGVQLGVTPGPETSLDSLVEHAKRLEELGLASMWMGNIFGFDALGALTVVGRETQRIELGTAVVPTFPRHPFALAQQALTAQAASGGRLTLGLGLSHEIVIQNMLGLSYEKPARHMREYLEVLKPLVRGERVAFSGEHYQVSAGLSVPEAEPISVMLAALGPAMLRLAGQLTDGTVTWMVGSKTLESHIIPGIRDAAARAGRPEPRVVAGFPIALTGAPEAAREELERQLKMYAMLPSYRAMLDREQAAGPADVSLVGDQRELEAKLDHLREIGVTDFQAALVEVDEGAAQRTLEFLASQS